METAIKPGAAQRLSQVSLYLATAGLGIWAFLSPFFTASTTPQTAYGVIRSADMPWMVSVVLGLCLLVLVYEVQGQGINTRLIALLGVLVAVNAALRFIEVALPGPGGFSPIFFLILMVGYVFGGRLGFLMGALTLLVSALVTGGVGPWLPGQMFTAGWVGMTAPVCRLVIKPLASRVKRHSERLEVIGLAILGAIWGLLYGAIMNLWAWPFMTGPADQSYTPGSNWQLAVQRYLVYYLVTSLAWDLARSAGNVLFITLFGAPTLRALRRFRQRFTFQAERSGNLEVRRPAQNPHPTEVVFSKPSFSSSLAASSPELVDKYPDSPVVGLHSYAWLAWLGAALGLLSLTRNPLYLILTVLVLTVVGVSLRSGRQATSGVGIPFLPFSAMLVVTAALFNALTAHFGDNPLFIIPGQIPLISGPVTLEALAYGATNGLVLGGIFTAFTILNAAVPVRSLIRLIPAAFYPVALVVSIAITFLPTILRRVNEIREAQAIRGHRLRGLRDWLPLFLPLLVDSLERALQLAEAMAARGFGGVPIGEAGETIAHRQTGRDRAALLTGLGLLLAGWLAQMNSSPLIPPLALILAGAGFIGWVFIRAGRRRARTVYRKEIWSAGALTMALTAVLVVATFSLGLPGLDQTSLIYSPYPSLALPEFNPLLGAIILGLLAPIFFNPAEAI